MTLTIQIVIPDEVIPFVQSDAEAQGLTQETYIRNALLTAWHSAKNCSNCKMAINLEMFKHIWEKEFVDGPVNPLP